MWEISRYLLFANFLFVLKLVSADIYPVKIGTEHHVNVVDSRFLSFTVDPEYLFSSSEKYNSKESVCMASSLAPAYIRIAGPSTSHMTFHNTTITFTDLESPNNSKPEELAVTHWQWKRFVQWAKKTGFDLVFALNNEDKTPSGLWDPNTALDILTVAEKGDVKDIFWQLGYECSNQTIEDYLNDLETLRVITETFSETGWKVVGSDVTKCLQTDSKSDFKDYVTLSAEMLDAVLLNGNSSAQELERMSEANRLKLLKSLRRTTTPLWLTESPANLFGTFESDGNHFTGDQLSTKSRLNELYRAADWMTSLGYSARNGFAVHFRELIEEELYEPTLVCAFERSCCAELDAKRDELLARTPAAVHYNRSFYMALLFKNLVGERVLQVDMEASEAVLFAHCTSLRRKAVPGAVTLYGANLDDEPARFSVKLSRREEGGDIMQFILAHDHSGNIVVNGRPMYHEGDIRPIVKRVRPYKTLLINLPPKSFGFWVLANTNIEVCQNLDNDTNTEFVEAEVVGDNDTQANKIRKRSMMENFSDEILDELNDALKANNEDFKKRIDSLNDDLKNIHKLLEAKRRKKKETVLSRPKRQTDQENDNMIKKSRLQSLRQRQSNKALDNETKPKLELVRRLFGGRPNISRNFMHVRKNVRIGKKKLSKRNLAQVESSAVENIKNTPRSEETVTRKRRSISKEPNEQIKDVSLENEIDLDSKDQTKLWRILRKIHEQLKDLPDDDDYTEYNDESKDEDQMIVKKRRVKNNYNENSKEGLLKSTVAGVVNVLGDLNKNLNHFWDALSLLD